MSTRMVTEYFKRELIAAGYETSDIIWSLGYCQGDGMAFEAHCDLKAIAKRLGFKPAKVRAINQAIEKACASIKVTHRGRYSHWNSMEVEADDHLVEEQCTGFERTTWAELVEAMRDDVKSISRRLEKEGYKLLENCNPAWFVKDKRGEFGEISHVEWRAFNIGRFRVVQKLVEDNDYNGYEFGNKEDHDDVKAIVKGEIVVCGVEVDVLDAEDDSVLGNASLWGITDRPELPYVRQCLRDVTRDAIAAARGKIARLTWRRA